MLLPFSGQNSPLVGQRECPERHDDPLIGLNSFEPFSHLKLARWRKAALGFFANLV
jgi:hypothetical protein